MRVVPLAFDSLGVRSMATFVETDLKIAIDPGVSFAPLRYGLPPTNLELRRVRELSDKVSDYAQHADVLIVSHYHHDHYFPEADFYKEKILLLKHPQRNINYNQRKRAKLFLKLYEKKAKEIQYADGRELQFSNTKIGVSPPVPHGEVLSKSGFVVMCSICHAGEKLVFASDVQGPQTDEAVEWIVTENPDVLVISGYPSYHPKKANPKLFEECSQKLIEIVARTKVRTVILDHHLTRDLEYRQKIKHLVEKVRSMGRAILTAAEFLGKQPDLLEARRKEIYKTERNDISPKA